MNKFNPALVAVDGNLSEHTLTAVVRFCNEGAVPGECVHLGLFSNSSDTLGPCSLLVSRILPVYFHVITDTLQRAYIRCEVYTHPFKYSRK